MPRGTARQPLVHIRWKSLADTIVLRPKVVSGPFVLSAEQMSQEKKRGNSDEFVAKDYLNGAVPVNSGMRE